MRAVLITGVQGVGKSTISQRAAEVLGMESWDYADLMLRVSPRLQSKDDIGRLPWDERNRIYGLVDLLLAEHFMPGDGRTDCVLLENHLSIVDDGGIRTFPHEEIRRYNPVGLVVVEAAPAAVVARRSADLRRDRHVGTVAEVAEQQATNRREAALIGQRWTFPVTIVLNDEPSRAAAEITAWVEQVTA